MRNAIAALTKTSPLGVAFAHATFALAKNIK